MRSVTNQRLVLTLLILTTSVSIASTDLYVPSLPHLPDWFSSTEAMVKLTMSMNLIGFALGQLILGPVSDRIGRRPTMLIGLTGYCTFSIACAGAQEIGSLIAFRFAQGLFAAVEASVGLAIIYEIFEREARMRALAIFSIAFAVTPALAPILGGYMHVILGWQSNFYLMGALGVLVLAGIWFWLPETATPRADALNPRRLLSVAGGILGNREFLRPTVIASACTASIFCYITAAPFLLIEVYGVRTEHFGYFHMSIVVAYIIGSILARQAIGRVSTTTLLAAGIACSLLGLSLLIVFAGLQRLDAFSLTGGACILFFGMGPIYAITPALAMNATGEGPGLGSALLHTGQMLAAGIAASLVSLRFGGPATPMISVLTLIVASAALLSWRLRSARAEQ